MNRRTAVVPSADVVARGEWEVNWNSFASALKQVVVGVAGTNDQGCCFGFQ